MPIVETFVSKVGHASWNEVSFLSVTLRRDFLQHHTVSVSSERELKTEVASWTQNLLGTKSALKKLVTGIRIPAEGTWRLTANWVCSWPCSSRHWNSPGKTEPATGVRRPWLLFWLKLLGWSPESKCLWGMTFSPWAPLWQIPSPPVNTTFSFSLV